MAGTSGTPGIEDQSVVEGECCFGDQLATRMMPKALSTYFS